MANESLPNIPTPAAQRWREFRIQVMPVMMFLCLMVSLVFMWRSFVQPAGILGEVQPLRANVSSLADGLLVELNIDLFQEVVKDQPIGRIVLRGDEERNASLRSVETELLLVQQRMNVDKTRNMDSLAQLKTTLATEKINLALAEISQHYSQREFERVKKLYEEKLVPLSSADMNQVSYDSAEANLKKASEEVKYRTQLVDELQKDFGKFAEKGIVNIEPMDEAVSQAIKAQQEVLRFEEGPQVLKAPMDGRVSMLLKRPGEKVIRGEPIVTISAPTSDRVIGYLRQPINRVPTTNDMVRVRTRSQKRLVASCPIVHVGPSLEPINPALLSPDVQRVEVGLPILISLPPQMRLVPGEFVDLAIQYAKQ